MRAIEAETFSGDRGLRQIELSKPQPARERVLVRVTAAGVTPLDHTILSGGLPRTKAPLVLGNEGAGVIEDAGGSGLAVGTRVMFTGPYGVRSHGIVAGSCCMEIHGSPELVALRVAASYESAPLSPPETHLTSDSPLPLTASQISVLRERLLEERARIQGAAVTLAPIREARERSAEDMDEAEANLVQHEALGRAAHDRRRLAFVERALQKIEAGTYGVSELSGEPIGYPRLSAVPWTRFSVEEQEQVERQARRYPGS